MSPMIFSGRKLCKKIQILHVEPFLPWKKENKSDVILLSLVPIIMVSWDNLHALRRRPRFLSTFNHIRIRQATFLAMLQSKCLLFTGARDTSTNTYLWSVWKHDQQSHQEQILQLESSERRSTNLFGAKPAGSGICGSRTSTSTE